MSNQQQQQQSSSSLKDFEVIKKLGEGSFAKVFKVIRKSDGKPYAMKRCKIGAMKTKDKDNALNEVRILASIQSPYVVGYKEAIFDEQTECLYVIMEYAAEGDLMNQVKYCTKFNKYLEENIIWGWAIQMLLGLKSLHDLKILHRDLKCANIFLDSQHNAKIGDLNVSKVTQANLAKTQVGTPYYTSPEVWKDQFYNNKSDIWSLGCVIYELCSLKPPFTAQDMPSLFKKVTKGTYERIPQRYSNELSNFLSSCLQVNEKSRFDCSQLLSLPALRKKAQELNIPLGNQENDNEFNFLPSCSSQQNILGVIKFPSNKNQLKEWLPQPSYNLNKDKDSKKISALQERDEVRSSLDQISHVNQKKIILQDEESILRRVRSNSGISLQRQLSNQPSKIGNSFSLNQMIQNEIQRRILTEDNETTVTKISTALTSQNSKRRRIISADNNENKQKSLPQIQKISSERENIPLLSNRALSSKEKIDSFRIKANLYIASKQKSLHKRDIPLPSSLRQVQQRIVAEISGLPPRSYR